MLTPHDLCKRFSLTLDEIATLYAKRVLPDGIAIGGTIRFRESDIRKFERYLKARRRCRDRGVDPDSPRGVAPPVYSTGGKPRFDPRLVVANESEAERQQRSRTLRAGSERIAPQSPVVLPEPSGKGVAR